MSFLFTPPDFSEIKFLETEGLTMVSDRPMNHAMGKDIFLIAIVQNQTFILMPKLNDVEQWAKMYLSAIEKYEVI